MQKSRRNLLETLRNKQSVNSEEPLKNIKEGLGSIAYLKGNPLTKTEITFNITIQFWDNIGGFFIAPGLLPAGGQIPLPIYIFGLTDFHGGYVKSRTLVPLIAPWGVNAIADPTWGIWNYNLFAVGFWNVNIIDGDMVAFFALNIAPIQYFAVVRVHCENVAYGTFLNNFSSDVVYLNMLRIITPAAVPAQLDQPLNFMYQTQFGKTFTDTVDVRMYTKPSDFQGNMADIPIKMGVDKNFGMNFYMNFDTQNISLILFIEKVGK